MPPQPGYNRPGTKRKTLGRRRSVRRRKAAAPAVITSVPKIWRMKLPAFPNEAVRDLNYVDNITASSTAGVLNSWQYRANSAYDIDYTGTGHQPFLFDQMATYYNHYRVEATTISMQAVPTTINPGVAIVCGLYLSDDTSAYTDYSTFMESGRGTNAIISPGAINVSPVTIKSSFNARRFFGKAVDMGNTSAAVTTNPTEQANFYMYMQSIDKASTSNQITFLVKIRLRIRFFEPKDVPAS